MENTQEKTYEILVVDDIKENLQLLSDFLTSNGYKVRNAINGKMALKTISAKHPDLILLDIKMPEMDGFEVCENLKKDKDTAAIPIIFISGIDDTQSKVNAFRAGGVDYITKPFANEEVLARVSMHLQLDEYLKHLKQINMEKDRLMFQQSKMAEMGEMIGNIAHQWRQPLSLISVIASNMLYSMELGKELQEKDCQKNLNDILNATNELSNTIDDFRNFFKPNKEKENFTLESAFEKTMKLLKTTFINRKVDIIKDIEEVYVNGFKNEMTQALVNILNNAKDALEEVEGRRLLFLNISKKENKGIISVMDNAGGVREDIINKIFDSYFTTKSDKKGTGIGLYMTKQIIEKHMHGSISVSNEEFDFENEHYKGAKFTITLPL